MMSSQSREGAPGRAAAERLARALNANSEAVVMFHSWVAQRMGLDPSAYKALFLLQRLGPLSAGELSRETGLATASVTDLIDRLVAKGFVERGVHPKDRRRIVVTLIEGSVADARPGFGVPNPSLAGLAERYDDDQLALIADFLDRNAQRLRDDLRRQTARDG